MEIRKIADDIPLDISLVVRLRIIFRNENINWMCWTYLKLPWKSLKRLQKDKTRHQTGIFAVFLLVLILLCCY